MPKLNNIKEVMVALANNKIIITADGERYSLDGDLLHTGAGWVSLSELETISYPCEIISFGDK